MKITFVLPYGGLAGGIRVAAIYAERLKKRGHEVVVVSTPPAQPSPSQQLISLLKGKGYMAQAIERICKLSEAEWQAMSDAAYAKATGYTWDDATELFESALYTAIERSRRGDFSNSDASKDVSHQ
jgi:hypothetical protein